MGVEQRVLQGVGAGIVAAVLMVSLNCLGWVWWV